LLLPLDDRRKHARHSFAVGGPQVVLRGLDRGRMPVADGGRALISAGKPPSGRASTHEESDMLL